ncbi:carboxypeptidase-like regulatory domain-containing protein [bacterium]|nr:carboxypeptidase-like regulatory domain-containing protein [bacterium]
MKSVKFVTLSALLIMAGINIASAQVSIEPIGIAVAIENEDTIAVDVTLTNNGDTDILYTIDFDEPEAEERGQGPRRDDIEGTFALFQDAETFGYVDTYVFQQIDDLDYEWFRNADDLVDVDLDDYTALWVETGNQSDAYKRNWDGNLERFEDYVSHGGVMFIEQGHNEGNNATHTTPGGLDYVWDPQEGNLSVGPDENWLVEQMGWEINRVDFQGGSFTHVTYPEDNLNEIEDCDWYQVIAEGRDNGEAAIIIYEYGRGNVIVSGSPCGHQWRNHNVQGRWGSCGETLLEWMSLLSKPGWIMSVPEEGVIDANSTAELEIIFSPLEMEAGVYEMYVLIELAESDNRDDLDENLIMISAIMSVGTPIANVTGTITDAANDNPVEDAKLDVSGHYFARFTDENGQYSADNMPLGDYEVTISATDFLTTVEEINIEEDGDLEWNLALLHSECTPSERQFFMQLEPGYTHEFEFQVDNGGNGPLTYAVDRRLLGDANAEPFELRQTDEIQDACGDDMLAGAVFAEEQFFISGGNNGGNPNKIYILNTDREVVGEFDQFVEDRYGMRDLAYDGELIWGAVEGTFYGFTTTGELEIEFSVDVNLEGRALAWDPVDQVLLASDISTDIFAINRDGDVVETYNRPAELRIYGLGVWPDDPDDCYLYVFCRGPDNVGINVFKLNPVNSEYMLVAYFDVGDGRPSGIQITNQLDVYSWVIVSLVQNPDRLNVWQLDARKEWFQVTPTAGVIEPDEHEGFVLTLDATGLPTDNDFCGEVVFMHDGIGQETALDVTLSVVEGRVQTTRDIDLHIGWNTISTNLQPNDNENIEGLVDSIVTTGAMIMMKNTNGDFYRPAYDFNNIQAWNS